MRQNCRYRGGDESEAVVTDPLHTTEVFIEEVSGSSRFNTGEYTDTNITRTDLHVPSPV